MTALDAFVNVLNLPAYKPERLVHVQNRAAIEEAERALGQIEEGNATAMAAASSALVYLKERLGARDGRQYVQQKIREYEKTEKRYAKGLNDVHLVMKRNPNATREGWNLLLRAEDFYARRCELIRDFRWELMTALAEARPAEDLVDGSIAAIREALRA